MRAAGIASRAGLGSIFQRRLAEEKRRIGDARCRTIAKAKSAARQADLAERGAKQDQRPIGLFAMIRALQRPCRRHHGAGCGHAARQCANGFGGHGCDCRRPIRILRDTVGFTHQVGQHPFEAGAITREKFLVVQAFADQRVDEREHHRGIGIGPDRDPSRSHRLGPIVAHWAHVDDLDACAR